MEENREEKFVRKIYREYVQDIAGDPLVRQEKRSFLARYFEPVEVHLGFGSFVPAACVLALFFVLIFSQMPYTFQQQTAVPTKIFHPSVEVKRSTSRIGQIMIYQKSYQDHPITIIWVFPS